MIPKSGNMFSDQIMPGLITSGDIARMKFG